MQGGFPFLKVVQEKTLRYVPQILKNKCKKMWVIEIESVLQVCLMCFVPVADSKDMVPSAMCFVLLNIGGVWRARSFSQCHQQRNALAAEDS